jgi:aminoglycoside 3-N-acetyltransferase
MFSSLWDLRRKYGLRKGISRRLRTWKNRFLSPSTEHTVACDLRKLGIQPGDIVLVHSAFSKIGYLRGGPQAFLDALSALVGREGTIVMPSFPFNDPAVKYARSAAVFDVLKTPTMVGQLQEQFRLQPGTLRSLHPTHPYCARPARWLASSWPIIISPAARSPRKPRSAGLWRPVAKPCWSASV